MRRTLTFLGTMCLGVILSAQTGTMNTRPANNTEGKILTMEETILSRELAPEDLRCRWIDLLKAFGIMVPNS